MSIGCFDAEQATGTADVAEGFEGREIELGGEGFEVDPGKASHSAQELFESGKFFLEFLKHALLAVFDFVLRLAGAESFRQIVPELEEAGVEHDENAADVTRAVAVEIESAGGSVLVGGRRSVALALQKLHGDQSVEKIKSASGVDTNLGGQVRAGQAV